MKFKFAFEDWEGKEHVVDVIGDYWPATPDLSGGPGDPEDFEVYCIQENGVEVSDELYACVAEDHVDRLIDTAKEHLDAADEDD